MKQSSNLCTSYSGTYEGLIEHLQPLIHAYAMRFSDRAETEDLEQEGRLAIWKDWQKVTTANNPEGYALVTAKHAISDAAMARVSVQSKSLEIALTRRGKSKDYQVDLPDKPAKKRIASLAQRRKVLGMLRNLTARQQRAILAYYRIEDAHNQRVPDKVEGSQDRAAYDNMKSAHREGLRRLRRIIAL